MADKAIFFDRDDTLIEDYGYINDPEQVKLLPGVAEALIGLRKLGYKLIVVSNQSGIARGILTEEVLEKIHQRLQELLSQEGAYLDQIYYCPYHIDGAIEKYRKESELRKPMPGMLLKAAEELEINLRESWMIGDKDDDILAGKRAGCRTIYVNPPNRPMQPKTQGQIPDYQAINIKEAVNIVRRYGQPKPIVQNQPEPIKAPVEQPPQTKEPEIKI